MKLSTKGDEIWKTIKLNIDEMKTYDYDEIYFDSNLSNLELAGIERADSENRIKEVKNSFNCNNFWATEATMNFSLLAYNLMSLFRQAVLDTKIHHFMKIKI